VTETVTVVLAVLVVPRTVLVAEHLTVLTPRSVMTNDAPDALLPDCVSVHAYVAVGCASEVHVSDEPLSIVLSENAPDTTGVVGAPDNTEIAWHH
jgi:hypothetical protein